MIAQAKDHGWDVVNSPSRFPDVLVSGNLKSKSAKIKAAEECGTKIISAEQWEEIMLTGEIG
jgi:NAD-dependent DNA ligase